GIEEETMGVARGVHPLADDETGVVDAFERRSLVVARRVIDGDEIVAAAHEAVGRRLEIGADHNARTVDAAGGAGLMDIRNAHVFAPLAGPAQEGDGFVFAEIPPRSGEYAVDIVDALRLAEELLSADHDVPDRAVALALERRLIGG